MAHYICHKHPDHHVKDDGKCTACNDFAFGPPRRYTSGTSPRWAFMKWFDIPDARDQHYTYLRRLRVVQTPWWALYLHLIYTPDLDKDPHDHPWNFWSFIVRGGYHEMLYDPNGTLVPQYEKDKPLRFSYRRFGLLSLHKMPITLAHRIEWAAPGLITLVFCGRRQREWGFWHWRTTTWQQWEAYNKEKYGVSDNCAEMVDEFG